MGDHLDWKYHVAFGALLSAAVFYFLFGIIDPFTLFPLVFLSAICALIPDIDHEMSSGKKLFDALAIIVAALIAVSTNSIILFFVILGGYFLAFKILKPRHRGITHTSVFGFVFSALVFLLAGLDLAISALLGYLSHLFLDRV